MKSFILAILPFFILAGCRIQSEVDSTPPPIPQGIRTVSLDNAVEISWLPSQAGDLSGYDVWRSGSQNGHYVNIGTVHHSPFVDNTAVNGTTYYYAVSAFDFADNESDLSTELVYDTPRPEGYSVRLSEATSNPALGGYDFSAYTVTRYDDNATDVFFEDVSGRLSLSVWSDADVQDMGYTSSLDEITVAPAVGWSPTKSAEAIAGHTYVVWTWDNHFAKVRVISVSTTDVTFDWAYQTSIGNPELKRAPLQSGTRIPIKRGGLGASD